MMTRDALVLIQSAVVRAACEQRTEQDLATLRASADQAANLPAGDGWERRAAAHVEFHNLLADATGNPVLAILVRSMSDTLHDIMVAVGPPADEVIVSSRGRLLRHLAARDAESAAGEIEEHLARLDEMRPTAGGAAGAATVESPGSAWTRSCSPASSPICPGSPRPITPSPGVWAENGRAGHASRIRAAGR
jgi:FCD domain